MALTAVVQVHPGAQGCRWVSVGAAHSPLHAGVHFFAGVRNGKSCGLETLTAPKLLTHLPAHHDHQHALQHQRSLASRLAHHLNMCVKD